MTTSDWLMILAILLAPVVAVQVQKYLELLREVRRRKIAVFEALMATRAARVSSQHVQALNMIELEFRDRKFFGLIRRNRPDREVRESWKTYLDHLETRYDEKSLPQWTDKGNDLFLDLLYAMAASLGYEFDRVTLKKGCYSPMAHENLLVNQELVMQGLVGVLTGKQAIPVEIKNEDRP